MTGYKIITARTKEDLEWLIEDLLAKNWEPHGPLVVNPGCVPEVYTQVMVLL